MTSKTKARVDRLRKKIAGRSEKLNITPAHDNKGHWYEYQGKKYPSVTKRLWMLKDPGLMNWKMNRAIEYVEQKWKPRREYKTREIREVLKQAKLVPVQEFEGAGDIGKQVHDWRENWFQSLIQDKPVKPQLTGDEDPHVISGCRAIQKFVEEQEYIPLACELYVAHHGMGLGGTLDDIGLLDDKIVLIDLKTSNIGDKNSYYAQVALYLTMFRGLYRIYPKEVYILHVSKYDGTYNLIPLHERVDINKVIRWSKKVVEVDKGLEELKQAKKVEPIVI